MESPETSQNQSRFYPKWLDDLNHSTQLERSPGIAILRGDSTIIIQLTQNSAPKRLFTFLQKMNGASPVDPKPLPKTLEDLPLDSRNGSLNKTNLERVKKLLGGKHASNFAIEISKQPKGVNFIFTKPAKLYNPS